VAHTGQAAVRLYNNTVKEQQMVSQSMTQVGKWSRRIVGGALVLALAGLSAPAKTSARYAQDETPIEAPGEDIYVFGKAPKASSPTPQPTISSFDTGTHTGAGVPNSAPSGGGSESGGGLFDGYGYVPSGSSGGYEKFEVEEALSWCLEAWADPDNSENGPLCNFALAVFDCEDQWGGTYSEIEELEVVTNHTTDGYPYEDVEITRLLGRCDIVNPYGSWLQLWYDREVGGKPIEICSGPTGQPGECWEP
jgi:hypothetical protein